LTAPFFASLAAFLSSILLLAACLTYSFASFNFSHLLLGLPPFAVTFDYSTALRWAASTANGFSGSTSSASSFPSSGTVFESGAATIGGSPISSLPSSYSFFSTCSSGSFSY